MKNCLVTKLKASVDNDELLKMGEIRATVSGTGEVAFRFNEAVDYSVNGVPQTPTDNIVVQVADTEKQISAFNKYKLREVWSYNRQGYAEIAFDIDALTYSDELQILRFESATNCVGNLNSIKDKTLLTTIQMTFCSEISGDLSDLENLSALTMCSLSRCNITGDLSSLSQLPLQSFSCRDYRITGDISSLPASLTSLTINGTRVTGNLSALSNNYTTVDLESTAVEGSVEAFLASMYNNGRQSGTCTVYVKNTNCTYRGNPIAENQYIATFDANGITVKFSTSGPIKASYDGSTWTYN